MPFALVAAALLASLTPEPATPPPPTDAPLRLAGDPRADQLNKAKWDAKKEIDALRFQQGCTLLKRTLASPIAKQKDDYLVEGLGEELDRCETLKRSHPLAKNGDLKETKAFAGAARRYGKQVQKEALQLLIANDPSVAARVAKLLPLKASFTMKAGGSVFDGDAVMLNLQDGLKKDAAAWGVPMGAEPSAFNAELEIVEVDAGNSLLKGSAMKPYALELKGTWTEAGGGESIPLEGSIKVLSISKEHMLKHKQVHERLMEAYVVWELNRAAGEPAPLLKPTPKIPNMFQRKRR
jgi:hypothetical protein